MRIAYMLLAAGAALTDTTDEGSLARYEFRPNELSAGKVFSFNGAIRATKTNGTDTLTPALRFGADGEDPSANTAISAAAAVDVADGDVCVVSGRIHVQSTTRIVIEGTISDCDAPGSKLLSAFAEVVDIAPNTAYYLDITGKWSVAHADNSVQAEAWVVTELAR